MKFLDFKLYIMVLTLVSYSFITFGVPSYHFDNRQSGNKYRLYLNNKLYNIDAHENKCITDAPSGVTKIEIRNEHGEAFNPPLVKKFTPIFGNRGKNKIIRFGGESSRPYLDVSSTDASCR